MFQLKLFNPTQLGSLRVSTWLPLFATILLAVSQELVYIGIIFILGELNAFCRNSTWKWDYYEGQTLHAKRAK